MRVRHAEKRRSRVSSCPFADAVATAVIETYHRSCPSALRSRYQQTVLAGIVLLAQPAAGGGVEEEDAKAEAQMEVVSIGVGTKVLPASLIVEDVSMHMEGNHRLHDCHAEVLAKRGFQCFLLQQAHRFQSDDTSLSHSLWFEASSLLQPPGRDRDKQQYQYRLKANVSVFLYSSSQPCGNATIKKWAKSAKPNIYPDLSCYEYPHELRHHRRLEVTARSQGQVAILVKREDHSLGIDEDTDQVSSLPSEIVIPSGMALPGTGHGLVMSCSDKISLWNALGLQGGLLADIFDPVYMDAIIIGRKFSQTHCQRALCCRLQDFTRADSSYSIHHPAMLNTSVIFDDSVYACAEDLTATDTDARQASFREHRCFSWWSDGGDAGSSSIIDSRSGYATTLEGSDGGGSPLSSYRMAQSYRHLVAIEDDIPYTMLKQRNVEYQSAKRQILSSAHLFRDWQPHRKRSIHS
jgi:hypothetical protein